MCLEGAVAREVQREDASPAPPHRLGRSHSNLYCDEDDDDDEDEDEGVCRSEARS